MTDEQGFDYTEEETAMAKSVIESMRMGSEMRFSVKRFDVSCPWPLADGTDCADDTEVLVVAWDNPKAVKALILCHRHGALAAYTLQNLATNQGRITSEEIDALYRAEILDRKGIR